MDTHNNMVNLLVVKDRNWGLSYFNKGNTHIDWYIWMKTESTLNIPVKNEVFDEIQSTKSLSLIFCNELQETYKEKLIKILNWLLQNNEEEVIHHKPFIWNWRIEDFIIYQEELRN